MPPDGVRMRRICIFAILIGALAGPAPAQSKADAETKAKIIALEQLWYQSFQRHDSRAIDSILDNTALLTNYDGSIQTKADYLASMKTGFSKPSDLQPVEIAESMEVRVFGTTGIAIGVYRIKGIEHGKTYSRRERFMDTWKCLSGSWVIIGTAATPVLH